MSYTLPTLPSTALPCEIIIGNNLQASVKVTVHVQAASCQYKIYRKIYGMFLHSVVKDSRIIESVNGPELG